MRCLTIKAAALLVGLFFIAACKTTDQNAAVLREDPVVNAEVADPDPLLMRLIGGYAASVDAVALENNNVAAFRRKLAIIRSAKESLAISYYIFKDGYSTAAFMKALVERARAGVKIRLIIDDNDHNVEARKTLAAMVKMGGGNIDVGIFRPILLLPEIKTLIKNAGALHAQFKGQGDIMAAISPLAQEALASVILDSVSDESQLSDLGLKLRQAQNFANTVASGQASRTKLLQDFLSIAAGRPVDLPTTAEILQILNRTHHKLIVADGKIVVGGGRNMWDISNMDHGHPLRISGKTDMDTDFFVENQRIAAEALATFDSYWSCLDDANCPAKIAMQREPTALADDQVATLWNGVKQQAKQFDESLNSQVSYKVVNDVTLDIKNVPAVYVENRMLPAADGSTEPSRYLAAIVAMLENVQNGDDILFENAYLVMPSEMLLGVVRALKKGAHITLISNGDNISDNKTVALLTRMQMEALLKYAAKIGKAEHLTYIENRSGEQLHTKIYAVGDYLCVGSANADPRSAYLNTENGLVIGKAPVTLDGKTYPNAAFAYRAMRRAKVEAFKSVLVADLEGNKHPYFQVVTVDDLKAILDLSPASDDVLGKVKARISTTFRNMFANTMYDTSMGKAARQSLYEQILTEF